MPYTHETNHIKLVGLQDRRRKLTDEQKADSKVAIATAVFDNID